MRLSGIIAIVLLISLFSIAYAKFTSAEMEVNMEWVVKADGQITDANLTVSIPSNTSNQKVTSIQISEPYVLEMDGSVWKARIELQNFSEKTVNGKFIVATDYIKRGSSLDNSSGNYLGTSDLVDINQDIKDKASEFSSLSLPNSTISIAGWVHEYVAYDKAYIGRVYPASFVIKSRRGVCSEYAHLFVAMVRSIGVPARVVVGYVFDSSGTIYENETWAPHAWAEVYDQRLGWVEVDPTYDDYMNLDALRVRTSTGADQEETKDSIAAVGFATDLNFSAKTTVSVLKKSDDSSVNVDIELGAQPEDSMHQPVIIVIRNPNRYPVFMTASLAVPQGIDCNCSGGVFLQPGESKEVTYDLNLSGAVMPDMKYNFSVKALTDYGSAEISFERLIVTQSYTTVKELPQSFMIFIGIAVIVAIVLIIAAIYFRA